MCVSVELVLSDVSSSRVSQRVENKMDKHNLARVFGPTLVGHAVPDPDPMTILHDTNRQPRVTKSRHSEFYMDAVGFFFTSEVLLLDTCMCFYFPSGCGALALYPDQVLEPVCMCR